jgi:hypothetical protein
VQRFYALPSNRSGAAPGLAWFWFAYKTESLPNGPYCILKPGHSDFRFTINEAGARVAASVMALMIRAAMIINRHARRSNG